MNLDGLKINFIEALSTGATLSATDPVTILAIFNVYKVEPKLYTVIFGESILNDAIAIVLFETAQRYKEGGAAGTLNIIKLFDAMGIFLLVFFGSLIIGVIVGIGTALWLKYTFIRRFPRIESCLILLIAYASYFFSTAVHMSGKHITMPDANGSTDSKLRYCVPLILRHHPQTLRILQHVATNPIDHQIRFSSSFPALRKFHLHLPWPHTLHRDRSRIQTFIHPRHDRGHLRRSLAIRLPSLESHQLVHPSPSSSERSRGG